MYFVYILKSRKTNKRYIGSTKNLEARLDRHNRGLEKYTKSAAPYDLIYFEEFETLSKAMKREKQLKSYKGGEALKKLLRE